MSKPALLSQREEGAGGAHTLGGLSETPLAAIPAHIPRALLCSVLPVMQCQRQESCSWGHEARRWVKNYCFQRIAAREERWGSGYPSLLVGAEVWVLGASCCVSEVTTSGLLSLQKQHNDCLLFPPLWLTPFFFFFFGSFESEESTSILFNFPRLEINQKLT